MKLIVLSDVHANILRCQDIALRNPSTPVIQIGDLGIGFVPREVIESLPSNFYFFVGNHDNRKIANSMRGRCLGDWGHWNESVFYVSGAHSKDKDQRTEGVNWWPDEELTYQQGQECIDEWERSEAFVLLSHDLPQRIAEGYYLIYDKCMTRNILERMTQIRKPKLHIYGHHHRHVEVSCDGVNYIGLKIDEAILLDISENNVTVTPL